MRRSDRGQYRRTTKHKLGTKWNLRKYHSLECSPPSLEKRDSRLIQGGGGAEVTLSFTCGANTSTSQMQVRQGYVREVQRPEYLYGQISSTLCNRSGRYQDSSIAETSPNLGEPLHSVLCAKLRSTADPGSRPTLALQKKRGSNPRFGDLSATGLRQRPLSAKSTDPL